MITAVNKGPVLCNTIIPPSSSVEDLELPGWVRSSAKMLNGGVEGQDWLALAKKLGNGHHLPVKVVARNGARTVNMFCNLHGSGCVASV